MAQRDPDRPRRGRNTMSGAEARCLVDMLGLTDGWLADAAEVSVSTVARWWADDAGRVPAVARLVLEEVLAGVQEILDEAALQTARTPISVTVPRSDKVAKKELRGYEMPATFWRVLAARIYMESRGRVTVSFSGPPGSTAWDSDPADDPIF